MKQPDFIIGGATRSGIHALTQILDHHPQIFIPQRKEHQFFHQEKILRPALETFKTQFEDAVHTEYKTLIPEDRILHGEQEYDPERAHAGCPFAKIIFTLRDPVERAYTQFHHALQAKKESVKTFEHAIEAELSGMRSPETTGQCWLYKNQYHMHIEHWLAYYPREKIHILIYEEWADPSHHALRSLEMFLGLAQNSLSLTPDNNDSFDDPERFLNIKGPRLNNIPPLSDATREKIEDILSVDKTYISNLLGREIPNWKSKF